MGVAKNVAKNKREKENVGILFISFKPFNK